MTETLEAEKIDFFTIIKNTSLGQIALFTWRYVVYDVTHVIDLLNTGLSSYVSALNFTAQMT